LLASALNVLLTVMAVSLIILVHEFGHFAMAKAVGMRVEVFSIGFWKKIVGFRLGETDYRVSLIPLGGYVKVTGEGAEGSTGEPYEFWSKTPGQRALFITGGVMMNFILAVVLFVIAFAVGVPLEVGEVGQVEHGSPAWEAGLLAGDRVVAVNDIQDPVFTDIMRAVALGDGGPVDLKVLRDGRLLTFRLEPEYDAQLGHKVIGMLPPAEPIVTGLSKVGGQEGRCPAEEAGIEPGDRILSINGNETPSGSAVRYELARAVEQPVTVRVERAGRELTFQVRAEPLRRRVIGISGIGTKVEALQHDGLASKLGLQVGDRIVAVNDRPMATWLDFQRVMQDHPDHVVLSIEGQSGRQLRVALPAGDPDAPAEFDSSVALEMSATLTWVREGSPAWQAGMRPGDTVVRVNGTEVDSWDEISYELSRASRDEHEITWVRGGETFTAQVQTEAETEGGAVALGVDLSRPKMVSKRYGVLSAVRRGFVNTFETLGEIFLMLRGFATHQVSPRTMGGIVTIARFSYHAAQLGIARLLHLTAMISASVGLLNILPIPVLDGGHLLLLAIEKVRGRRLGERVVMVAQSVGFVLLMMLVAYVTWNDLVRWLRP